MTELRSLASIAQEEVLNPLEREKLKLRIGRIVKEIEAGGDGLKKKPRRDRQVLGMLSPKQNRKSIHDDLAQLCLKYLPLNLLQERPK